MRAHEFIEYLQETQSDITLNSTNNMYVANHFQMKENYITNLEENFDAVAKNLDFSQSETSRSVINSDVETATNSKIKDFIPSG